jgi:hypothetical protein
MSNVRFLHTFPFDAATITSSSEAAGLPDDNAIHPFVARVWRTTGCGTVESPEWIKFYLGTTAEKITMVALFGHNLTSGATVKLQAYSEDAWTVPPAYESPAMTWNAHAIVLFLNQTYKWWRVTLADPDNGDGYIEIGRICAGEYYEPAINITEDLRKRIVDPSDKQESEGRQGYAVEKQVYRVYEVKFTGISRTQQGELETMFRSAKNIRPLAMALDPDNYPEDDTIYCMMTTPLDIALGALEYGDVTIGFEEKVS